MVSTYTLRRQDIRQIQSKNRYMHYSKSVPTYRTVRLTLIGHYCGYHLQELQLQAFQTEASLSSISSGSCHLNSVWPILMYFMWCLQILTVGSLHSLCGHRRGGPCVQGKLPPLLTFYVTTLSEGSKVLGPMPSLTQTYAIPTSPAGIQAGTGAQLGLKLAIVHSQEWQQGLDQVEK